MDVELYLTTMSTSLVRLKVTKWTTMPSELVLLKIEMRHGVLEMRSLLDVLDPSLTSCVDPAIRNW